MSKSNTNRTINAIVRGVFLGGALGLIASWFIDYPMERAAGLGMLAGVAATLTLKDRLESRLGRRKTEADDSEDNS